MRGCINHGVFGEYLWRILVQAQHCATFFPDRPVVLLIAFGTLGDACLPYSTNGNVGSASYASGNGNPATSRNPAAAAIIAALSVQ